MPNWIEGSLKIRGPYENVLRFFKEGLDRYVHGKAEPEPKENWLKIDEFYGFKEISILKDGVHINNTRRAFIDSQDIYFREPEEALCVVTCLKVQQAWCFDEEDWIGVSKKYGIDIRLYGIECGMGFDDALEVHNGDLIFHQGTEYRDYDDFYWRCPFPNMGG